MIIIVENLCLEKKKIIHSMMQISIFKDNNVISYIYIYSYIISLIKYNISSDYSK